MAKATVVQREPNSVASINTADITLREEAKQARDMVELGYMKLARCLYDIYYQGAFRTWEYNSFEDYVDSEIQINYRKAMYLVEIYNKAVMLNMDMQRLENIGWTKARELIKVVDLDTVDDWLEIAEDSTYKELTFKVNVERDKKEDRASIADSVPSTTTITLRLGEAENAIIQEAVEQSASLINTDDLALALTNICQEWIELKGIVPIQTSLEDRIELLEQIYGQRLVVAGVANDPVEDKEGNVEDDLELEEDVDDELF